MKFRKVVNSVGLNIFHEHNFRRMRKNDSVWLWIERNEYFAVEFSLHLFSMEKQPTILSLSNNFVYCRCIANRFRSGLQTLEA